MGAQVPIRSPSADYREDLVSQLDIYTVLAQWIVCHPTKVRDLGSNPKRGARLRPVSHTTMGCQTQWLATCIAWPFSVHAWTEGSQQRGVSSEE